MACWFCTGDSSVALWIKATWSALLKSWCDTSWTNPIPSLRFGPQVETQRQKTVWGDFVLQPCQWHWPWFPPPGFLELLWVLAFITNPMNCHKSLPIHFFLKPYLPWVCFCYLPIKNCKRSSSGSERPGLPVLLYDLSMYPSQNRYSINVG